MSKRTGWGLAEILDLEIDEFLAWFKNSQVVENEIAGEIGE